MKFLPRFDFSRQSVWMSLLVAVLLVSGPLYASEEPVNSGTITAVDVVGRVIEIDQTRYVLALQAEVKDASSDPPKTISIADLKVDQYVNFEANNKTINSLSTFVEGPK